MGEPPCFRDISSFFSSGDGLFRQKEKKTLIECRVITAEELLDACAGASVEAFSVLQQMQLGQGLSGVSAGTLLNTGLRKQKLMELGYSISNVVTQTGATSVELRKLGFSV